MIEVTTKDSGKKEFVEGFVSKKLVFKGSLEDCEKYLSNKRLNA